jgi:hypothetical protein
MKPFLDACAIVAIGAATVVVLVSTCVFVAAIGKAVVVATVPAVWLAFIVVYARRAWSRRATCDAIPRAVAREVIR